MSDVETDPWPAGNISALAARSARWLVTRGEFGADEYLPSGNITHLPAVKVNRRNQGGYIYESAISKSGSIVVTYECPA